MLLLVVVSRAKHLRSATILEEDVEDEDEDDVEAKPLAATRRANMNFLMEQNFQNSSDSYPNALLELIC